jgi:uncharacterized protein YgiM (DUF1202 family)
MKGKIICLALAGTLGASIALAREVFVTANYVFVYQDKGSYYPVVAKVPHGTELSVLDQDGKWLKVQAADKQGYVYETSLAPNKPDMSGFNGVSADSKVTEAAAAKGLGPKATTYAQGKNLDPKPLQDLIDFRMKITAQDFVDFDNAGKVGIAKP